MKKFLAMLLVLAMLFTLAACGQKEEDDRDEGVKSKKEPATETTAATKEPASEATKTPTEPPADAKTLIAQGKYEEAYVILYANKSDKEAAELLKDFVWVYEEIETVSPGSYDSTDTENYKYTYDADGKLIKEVETITRGELGEGGIVSEHTYENIYTYEYTYDSNGNLIKEIAYDDEGNADVVEYSYSVDGELIKKEEQGGKTEEYTYDSAKNLVKKTIQYLNGTESYEYTYDAEGNVTKQIWNEVMSADGSVYTQSQEYIFEYAFDSNERLIKKVETIFGSSLVTPGVGIIITYEYTYDTNGNLIKEHYTNRYRDPYTIEYTYDSDGNLIQKRILEEDSSGEEVDIETHNYTYDSNGNLLKEVATTTNDNQGFPYTIEYSGYKLFYKPAK